MSVTPDHAARIAALARLRFDDADLKQVTLEMNKVLAYVEELRDLEAEGVPSDSFNPLEGEGDATRGPEADSPDTLLVGPDAFAPDARAGFFVVPPLPGVHAEGGE